MVPAFIQDQGITGLTQALELKERCRIIGISLEGGITTVTTGALRMHMVATLTIIKATGT